VPVRIPPRVNRLLDVAAEYRAATVSVSVLAVLVAVAALLPARVSAYVTVGALCFLLGALAVLGTAWRLVRVLQEQRDEALRDAGELRQVGNMLAANLRHDTTLTRPIRPIHRDGP
jgi:hypothetical protein